MNFKMYFNRETFSKNRRRKRPNIALDTIDQVFDKADEDTEKYIPDKDIDLIRESDGTGALQKNPLLNAGQSKRIWGELYRVLDSSDVIIQVLDARDPMGMVHKLHNQLEIH
jgi:nuclear GTP-binding protein